MFTAAATHPIANRPVPSNNGRGASLRNVNDLRYFRVDNDMSTNGRDVFIPYFINKTEMDSSDYFKARVSNVSYQRHFFLTAACRDPTGERTLRGWRREIYWAWKDLNRSIVSLDYLNLNDLYSDSEFCVIIPGDTSSSAKLYKAIFSGCIPIVFVSYVRQLPFSSFIDWSYFSVVIVKDIIYSPKGLKEIIDYAIAIRNDSHLLKMFQSYLSLVAPLFDWDSKKWPNAFDLSMLELVVDGIQSTRIFDEKKSSYVLSRSAENSSSVTFIRRRRLYHLLNEMEILPSYILKATV